MATYKEIHGINVQYRDSDATAIEGDVWYNASTGLLKMYSALGSWATGGALNTARYAAGGFGIQTAAKLCGNKPAATLVQDYDGSAWTTGTSMTTARQYENSAGTTTAGIVIGGGPPAITTVEEFSDPGVTTITTST